MTSLELGNLIRERLGAVGLVQYLDETKEQYLEFPDGFFAEIVLKDGSKLSEAQRVLKSVEEELRKQGIELDAIVRATWTVSNVEYRGELPVPSEGSKLVYRFHAFLQSGNLKGEVDIDVSEDARRELLKGTSAGQDEEDVLREFVSNFLQFELSRGGESFWDPLQDKQRDLNILALPYLTAQGSPKPS